MSGTMFAARAHVGRGWKSGQTRTDRQRQSVGMSRSGRGGLPGWGTVYAGQRLVFTVGRDGDRRAAWRLAAWPSLQLFAAWCLVCGSDDMPQPNARGCRRSPCRRGGAPRPRIRCSVRTAVGIDADPDRGCRLGTLAPCGSTRLTMPCSRDPLNDKTPARPGFFGQGSLATVPIVAGQGVLRKEREWQAWRVTFG